MSTEEYQLLMVADKDVRRRVHKAMSGSREAEVNIIAAESLSEALKLLATRPVDAALVDVCLTESPGIRGCLRLRQADRHLPMIALARRSDEDSALNALHAGAQDFVLLDELDPDQLLRALRYAVERQAAASRLASEEALLQSILQNVSEGVVVADRNEKLLLVNPAARRMLGIGSLAGLPSDLFGLYRADTGDPLSDRDRPLARAVRGETVSNFEIFHRNAGAPQGVYLSANARPLKDPDGIVTGGIVSIRDISDRKRAEDELAQLALYDRLTNVPNRSFFVESLGKAISRARRSGTALAVLLLNLDRFQRINDELGSEGGDQVLRDVARRLTGGLRAGDFVARLGRDEFAVLFEDYGHFERAAGLADKIQQILTPPLRVDEREVRVTASIGISSFPDCGEDPVTLLKTADIAMCRAKEGGRSTYHFYSRSVHAEVSRRTELEAGLRRAITEDQFGLAWEPIVDVEVGRVVAVEALLRWRHPELGLIRPMEFVPILESAGLIHRVGERVLAESCSELADWRRELARDDVSVAVRVSTRQLEHPRLIQRIERVLTSAGLGPSSLILECGEEALGPDRPECREVLSRLAAAGVRIALEGFGRGWISLEALRDMKIEWLKLDREFVAGLPVDEGDCLVANAAAGLAGVLRAEFVGCGVQSTEQLAYLVDQGCRLAQGTLLSGQLETSAVPAIIASGVRPPT
jgi:diguanylate cyclase (GGDEF)-like protein/PAS domain S-box-containing protein